VRSLDAAMDRVKATGAPVVTIGGQPVSATAGRAVMVRDPDGYLVQLVQASASEIAAAAPGDVISTAIGISVADTASAMKFYRGLLGFEAGETRAATAAERQLHGVAAGQLTQTTTHIPGTSVSVVFLEFKLPAGTAPAPRPFRWRIQDVGAPQFQLQVRDLDALIEQTKQAGYRFLSIGARPIQRAFGRFVFAIDPDGVLVEYVEPAAPR
jgi:catechol 2,3-dioxygenase-like lactoylglutathione lyase family enzyme